MGYAFVYRTVEFPSSWFVSDFVVHVFCWAFKCWARKRSLWRSSHKWTPLRIGMFQKLWRIWRCLPSWCSAPRERSRADARRQLASTTSNAILSDFPELDTDPMMVSVSFAVWAPEVGTDPVFRSTSPVLAAISRMSFPLESRCYTPLPSALSLNPSKDPPFRVENGLLERIEPAEVRHRLIWCYIISKKNVVLKNRI